MRPLTLPALCLAVTAAIFAHAAAAGPVTYRALGTEPFWALSVECRVVRLEQVGRRTIRAGGASVRPSFNGQRVLARGMTVDITRTRCSDGMSDRVYPDTVTVQVGRRMLRGCGGVAAAR